MDIPLQQVMGLELEVIGLNFFFLGLSERFFQFYPH